MTESRCAFVTKTEGLVGFVEILRWRAVLINDNNSVLLKHECATCLGFEIFFVTVVILCQSVQFGFVEHTEVFIDRCFGVDIRLDVEIRIDGILFIPTLSLNGITY